MPDPSAAEEHPVEAFRPTSGYWLGWFGVVLFAAVAAEVLGRSRSGSSLAAASALAWGALVMWIGLVRPRVLARSDHVLLRNAFRDTAVPWHLVDGVLVRLTLRVYVGDEIHQAASISRGARPAVGGSTRRRGQGLLGVLAPTAATDPDAEVAPPGSDYAGYVETRLRDLASERRAASAGRDRVTTSWALGPTVAFAALSLLTVVLLVASW
jgi:hypothetical protein